MSCCLSRLNRLIKSLYEVFDKLRLTKYEKSYTNALPQVQDFSLTSLNKTQGFWVFKVPYCSLFFNAIRQRQISRQCAINIVHAQNWFRSGGVMMIGTVAHLHITAYGIKLKILSLINFARFCANKKLVLNRQNVPVKRWVMVFIVYDN